MNSKLHSKLAFKHHPQLERPWVERRGAQRWEGSIIFSLAMRDNFLSCRRGTHGHSQVCVTVRAQTRLICLTLSAAGSPGSSSCLWMMRFCSPAGNEKSDYQHFVLLMKLPLLLSRDPCVPWSSLRSESCVP